MTRVLTNILSDRLDASRDFFTGLLAFEVVFESHWYVQVAPAGEPDKIVGVWRRDHELIPTTYQQAPRGVVLTVVVADVDAAHERARRLGVEVVEPPTDRFYGQRRMLILDPNGLLVDVSTPIASATADNQDA
jgi:catechol 2,3-dioxygenase-like lactoylglutathione lyase family enzyme